MTIGGKSWLVVLYLLIVLSSVKIHRITQNALGKDHTSNGLVLNLGKTISGAHAMAMQFSMQMPMGMSGFPPSVNLPKYDFPNGPDKVFIQALPDSGQFRQTIPLRNQQIRRSMSQQYQPPTQPSGCQCGHHQQHRPQQQPPQQQPQVQQRSCCPNAPPPNCPPCPQNTPNQYQPGPSLVPIAQIILAPKDSEADDDSRDRSSDEIDDCVHKCREKVTRRNADRKDLMKNAGYRRINKRQKPHSRQRDGTENEIKYKPLSPVLSYIGRNGDVKFETKITDDDALDLIHDFSDIDLKRHKRLTEDTAFLFEDGINPPRNMAMTRTQDDNVKEDHTKIPGKQLLFQSPSRNEIANLSFTFLFT